MHTYRRRAFLQLSAAAVGAGLSTLAPVHAQTPAPAPGNLQQFDIELAIFRVVTPSGTPEEWAAIEARMLGAPPVAGELPAPDATTALPSTITNFPPLDVARQKLESVAVALQRSKQYQLLAHFGWTQPGYPLDMAPKVDITNYLPPNSVVTGTIALARGRYLHVSSNLIYQSPEGRRYVLHEQRRMQRSGEKHYLDHPLFGAVVVVTPRG